MTVTLLEILAAARAHAAPLAAESAGYLLLAVADSVAVAPREVGAEDVELASDGTVRVRAARARGVASDGAERAVRHLLERALEVSSSVGPALRRAANKREPVGLGQLVRELEAALIPVNRSAARRALSRLYRETDRARAQGKLGRLEPEALPEQQLVVEPKVPVVAPPPVVVSEPEPVLVAADFPEPATPEPVVVVAPVKVAPPVLTLSPPSPPVAREPTPAPAIVQLELSEQDMTKPEPVVARAKERGSSTPKLGTVVTAQTLLGEEAELTERAPAVLLDEEPIVIVEEPIVEEPIVDEPIAVAIAIAPSAPAPLVDPEPSAMPDVVLAMVALHAGIDTDDAPTRLRVVTAPRELPIIVEVEPAIVEPTPEPEVVEDEWLTQSSLEGVETSVGQHRYETARPFVSELAEPVVHEALTWDPGPVVASVREPLPPALVIGEPLPEPSPYAPAVLPTRPSDVSELLDSFYVSGAAEERELREGLKQLAGLELTPMPLPLVDEG